MSILPRINTVWIGRTLGPIHAACLRSFLQTGHNVRLYCYYTVEDAPSGVQIMDAQSLFPREDLITYPGGSYAISANIIRYRMMALGLGLYIDCDVFCLNPLDDAEYLWGLETNKEINNAVLKLPSASPLVEDLCAIQEGWVPPWLGDGPRLKLAEYPWGTTGPRALTYLARKHKVARFAKPIDVFYPIHHQQTSLLADPDIQLSDLVTPRTRYLHLYNNSSGRYYKDSPPRGSPLWQLLELSET